MSFLKGRLTLTWSPVGGVFPTDSDQWPCPCSLSSFWSLPHPTQRTGVISVLLLYLLTPRISLPPRCLGSADKSEGLERTPPLLGLLSPLPAKQGMACTSGSAWCIRGLGPVASLSYWRGGFGESFGWLWFLSSSCWRKCQRVEGWEESCPGPGVSEGSKWMVGTRMLEEIGLLGRNSSSYALWAGV